MSGLCSKVPLTLEGPGKDQEALLLTSSFRSRQQRELKGTGRNARCKTCWPWQWPIGYKGSGQWIRISSLREGRYRSRISNIRRRDKVKEGTSSTNRWEREFKKQAKRKGWKESKVGAKSKPGGCLNYNKTEGEGCIVWMVFIGV